MSVDTAHSYRSSPAAGLAVYRVRCTVCRPSMSVGDARPINNAAGERNNPTNAGLLNRLLNCIPDTM